MDHIWTLFGSEPLPESIPNRMARQDGLRVRLKADTTTCETKGQTPMYLANFSGATLPPVTMATTCPTG